MFRLAANLPSVSLNLKACLFGLVGDLVTDLLDLILGLITLGASLGDLIHLDHGAVVHEPLDGLGTTDGLANGRHPSICGEDLHREIHVLDVGALELVSDVILGHVELKVAREGIEGQRLASTLVRLHAQVGEEGIARWLDRKSVV